MLDELGSAPEHASRTVTADRSKRSLLGRFATQFSDSPVSFDIILHVLVVRTDVARIESTSSQRPGISWEN